MIPKLFPNRDCPALPKRERRKEARPGELLAAALALFVEKGYAATRSEEVARRAGVSKGTLFLYYASKEELFKAVVRDTIAGRFPEWNAEFDAHTGSSADLLRYALTSWWERVGNTQASGITKLMVSEASNFPELAEFYQREVIAPGRDLIRRILERGVASGEFRAVDVAQSVFVVMAPIIFLMTWMHSFGNCRNGSDALEPEKYLATQIDILLQGLCQSDTMTKAPAAP